MIVDGEKILQVIGQTKTNRSVLDCLMFTPISFIDECIGKLVKNGLKMRLFVVL